MHKNVIDGRASIPIASISSLLCRHCDVLEVDLHTGGWVSAPLEGPDWSPSPAVVTVAVMGPVAVMDRLRSPPSR